MGRPDKYIATVPDTEILPVINDNFESSVKGIFVIGDVTGLPLVKVAANQGVDVIAKMADRGLFENRAEEGRFDVVIIGGGPAGLSAAIEAEKRGLRHVLFERAKCNSTIHTFPPGKKVYSEPRFLKNRSELPVEGDREKQDYLEACAETAQKYGVEPREDTAVERVRKRGEENFVVDTSDGEETVSRFVLVCVGRQGRPRRLTVPGADREEQVTYRFHTAEDYRDEDILVVGGGNSAVEAALMLCGNNRVTISYRQEDFFRLKPDNDKQIRDAMKEDRIEVIFNSEVTEIRESEVVLTVDGEKKAVSNDHVICQIGSLPPIPFLLDMGLEMEGIWTKKRVFWCVFALIFGYLIYFQAKHFVLLEKKAGDSQIYVPGFSWLYEILPPYFANVYGLYYLLYFVAIAVFGVYWAMRYRNGIIWRRNIIIIVTQWTLWWGLPTLLAVFIGRNAWTPVLSKSLNAWPLNMFAFEVAPAAGPGDPAWWHVAAVAGVIWAVVLTFFLIPLFTLLVGKHYCSHICSCGALAETAGNSFRHRAPKGDWPRRLERMGFVFIPLASIAAIAHALGIRGPFEQYNLWAGTLLAGALGIGFYPFLGQRIWCRYWCPLAFWMNFWGRWSRFRISAEPGKCIDCNVCNQYCQMGIDIKSRALRGAPVTLKDTPCVACGECVTRCPMEILHLGDLPEAKTQGTGQR
jgi:thioredoxin reductase/NAD-dependent dihydropyrimidine dehydrogenase PreA subunit